MGEGHLRFNECLLCVLNSVSGIAFRVSRVSPSPGLSPLTDWDWPCREGAHFPQGHGWGIRGATVNPGIWLQRRLCSWSRVLSALGRTGHSVL